MRMSFHLTVALAFVASALALDAQDARPTPAYPATVEGVRAFLDEANRELLRLGNASSRAGWTQATYITPDTEQMAAEANEALVNAQTRYAREAARFDALDLPAADRRQLIVLKNSLTMSAPPDPKEAEELTRLVAGMEGAYGRAKYCPGGRADDCLDVEKITEILADDRNPPRLLEVWDGWHAAAIPMRKDYARFVELSNKGARALGYADTGAMWRSRYDMPPDAVRRRHRSRVAAAAAAVRLAPRLRPAQAPREVRQRRLRHGSDPRAPARQHLAAGLVEHLPAGGPTWRGQGLFADRAIEGQEDRCGRAWCGPASASSPRSDSSRCRRRSGNARSS